MKHFHGDDKKSSYFEGWYFKQVCREGTIAFIPAFHVNKKGVRSASLQIITDEEAYNVKFPINDFYAKKNQLLVKIDESQFSAKGCEINIKMRDLQVKGKLCFESLAPPKYDIMGPFKYMPLMECRHKVVSMMHKVNGQVVLNGSKYRFRDDMGYIEGDRGISFPHSYLWTQCIWEDASIMVSIADIPFLKKSFEGCIGFIYMKGMEYRLATYLGVKILQADKKKVVLKQGKIQLEVYLLKENPKAISAPDEGNMDRTIHESASCKVRYRLYIGGKYILDRTSEQASYEWDM